MLNVDSKGSVKLRDPSEVMKLSRMGNFHQSRLSFMRILMRKLRDENWNFKKIKFDINKKGVGHAVYSAVGPVNTYSLVAFAHDLPDDKRSDRVIADAWDATFTLFDGVPTNEDIERLAKNVPFQEVGRISENELCLSRANKSVRLWDHVISSLSNGRQPEIEQIDSVGYLMRTTAVYGSGKFGAVDRDFVSDRTELAAPFQSELLSVFMIRWFVLDLVNHMAMLKNPEKFVSLDSNLAHRLGIGNSTGLGMAPFLLNHPTLLNNWILARETALSRVRSIHSSSVEENKLFLELFEKSCSLMQLWRSDHPLQIQKLKELGNDLELLKVHLKDLDLRSQFPWNQLYHWTSENLSLEGQELIVSLMMEPYGGIVDELSSTMSDNTKSYVKINGLKTVGEIRMQLRDAYSWIFKIDWEKKEANARAWYVSQEKLEPRLGERFSEPVEDYEQPLSPARDAYRLSKDLNQFDDDMLMANFLMQKPEHRHTIRRLQIVLERPYAEIQDNTIGSELLPIDMLRCKLSFFGAIHFDPKSDRWVRICMFKGAPYPDQMSSSVSDYWCYLEGFSS
jgi:hypothetical protein|tara:strand:- start:1299 stop:2993 length:1695 start_codon:yes stop_codon:yes gene_type:complete